MIILRRLRALGAVVPAAFLPALLTLTATSFTTNASAAERDTSGVIEEIVVTSRRRDESQQDVPLSVTAFNAEAIEQLKPTTLRDFDGLAPNVYIGMNTAGPSASAIFIRGVGYAEIEKTQTPQVGVIVDGVQIGSSTGQLIDVFDVESIEVNRGPQGVFFGKNTIGGNIVVNRVRPTTEKFGFKASAELGNYDSRIFKARVNIPLGDMFALKVGAIERERDGFYDNLTLGGTAGDVDFSSQTVALRFKPNESFDAILTYDRVDDSSQTLPQDPRFNGDNPFENLADKREPTEYEVDQLGLRINWDLNDSMTINSITALHDSSDLVNQDFDGGSLAGLASPFAQLHTLRDQEYEVFTQELRFNWAINDKIDVMLGAYIFDSELDFQQTTNNVLQIPLGLPAGVPCAAIGFRDNPVVGNALCQLPNARSLQSAGEDVESTSLFASVTLRPTENLEFNIGARRIDEEKDARNRYFDYSDGTFDTGTNATEFAFPGTLPITGQSTPYTVGDEWDDTIISASAKWLISERFNLYASYSEGFRSGGFSIRNAGSAATAAFDPESADQIEIGLKTEWFDNTLQANLAYFILTRDESQFSSIIPLPPGSIPGTTTIINNGGSTEIKGIELETRWLANENWSVVANFGILDVENDTFSLPCEVIDGCVTVTPGILDPVGTPRNFGGNDDSRQPEWNASLQFAYGAQMGPGFFSANVGWKKVGKFLLVNTGGGADQRLVEGGYIGVDARMSYELQMESGNTFTVTAFGKNLTDEEWKEQALFLGGPNTGFQGWGAPRTFAIEFTYEM